MIRVSMIGQRGVPASHGGIERHVEEIGARLAAMGFGVTVYCRNHYSPQGLDTYRGMRLRYARTTNSKHLEAFSHSAAATAAAMGDGADIIHFHALGPGLFTALPRVGSRAKVVQTVHGLDHERAKWGGVASRVLALGGWLSGHIPDQTIVVSRALQRHYRQRYGRETEYVCNGVDKLATQYPPCGLLEEFGLTRDRYILFVGRLVPEKAPELLLGAFARLRDPNLRLVIAGASSHTDEYVDSLRALAAADPRVVMPGSVHNARLHELYANAAAFVLPSDVEGMPLTLLEAAAHGTPLIASDIAPHREMLAGDGPGRRLFRQGDEDALVRALTRVLGNLDAERDAAQRGVAGVFDEYNWDHAADRYAALYERLACHL